MSKCPSALPSVLTIGDLAGVLVLGLDVAVRDIEDNGLGDLLGLGRVSGLGVRHYNKKFSNVKKGGKILILRLSPCFNRESESP